MKKKYQSRYAGQKRVSRSGTVYEIQADGSWRKVGFLTEEQTEKFMKVEEAKEKVKEKNVSEDKEEEDSADR